MSPGTIVNGLTKCGSFNYVRDGYPHSSSVFAFDGQMVLVFRDDDSDHGPVNRPQSRRTSYDAVEHEPQAVTQSDKTVSGQKRFIPFCGRAKDAIRDSLNGQGCDPLLIDLGTVLSMLHLGHRITKIIVSSPRTR